MSLWETILAKNLTRCREERSLRTAQAVREASVLSGNDNS
ncbi:MAG: hypothetical protein CM15mV25_1330 [uncultured marine virus]|nr:MAG: hypothetical protein CM15mV25_1330 [uncultured marine virus]